MAQLLLHKVLVQEYKVFLRGMYAEDRDLLKTFDGNIAVGLDKCVDAALLKFDADTDFYKIELQDGTLVGYMGVVVEPVPGISTYYIRKKFRFDLYNDAFSDLMADTIIKYFTSSTGDNNIIQ